jgi:DNA polymerase III delta subunit
VIKDILRFKDNFQDFLLSRVDNLPNDIIIVFDIISIPREQNPLLNKLLEVAKVIHFKSKKKTNAFDLAYEIERKQVGGALNILADLFRAGEKPERILGALGYQFTKQGLNPDERLKKVDLLLAADVTIKTGKLKAQFALEMLVIRLCKLCS